PLYFSYHLFRFATWADSVDAEIRSLVINVAAPSLTCPLPQAVSTAPAASAAATIFTGVRSTTVSFLTCPKRGTVARRTLPPRVPRTRPAARRRGATGPRSP